MTSPVTSGRRALTSLAVLVAVATVLVGVVAAPADAAIERDLQRLEPDPFDIIEKRGKFVGADRQHIVVWPDRVELLDGAQVVWEAPFQAAPGPDGRGVATLADVERAVSTSPRPDWLDEVEPGVHLLRVALTQGPGSSLVYGGPEVDRVLLADRYDVYLSGVRGDARFEDVVVMSWDEATGAPNPDHTDPRPFVVYTGASRFDVVDSRMSYLGSDRSKAYGVSWDTGTTGGATGSRFSENFFGVYSFESRDLVFRHNVFADNALYGFDPHDYTVGTIVEDNEAYGNGSHGFIVSAGVTDGVFRNNHSHHNAANGIVLDKNSDRNLVVDNLVEDNEGDGIVLLNSSHNTVRDNVVRRNRVGIRANRRGGDNRIVDNEVVANRRGVELYGGAHDIELTGNRIVDSATEGLVMAAPASVSRSNLVSGSPLGIRVRSLAEITETSVLGAEQGVVVEDTGIAVLDDSRVRADEVGVVTAPGGLVRIAGSTVSAPEPLRGEPRSVVDNRLVTPSEPLSWLALSGLLFVVVAVLLQLLHHYRNRSFPTSWKEAERVGLS